MPRLVPLVVLAVLGQSPVAAEGPTRYAARLVGTLDGQLRPSLWVELVVEGEAEAARRACAALVALERREVALEGKVLRPRVERPCATEPLPALRRGGVWLRSRDGLPMLELMMAGITSDVGGQLTSWSAMGTQDECERVRRELERRAVDAAAMAHESARAFLVEEHAQASAAAERACQASAALAGKRLPRGKRPRLEHLVERARLERACTGAQELVTAIAGRIAAEPAAPSGAAPAQASCERD